MSSIPLYAVGASGLTHQLWAAPLGTQLLDLPGVYAFCGVNWQNRWVAYYVGKSSNGLNGRVGTSVGRHEKCAPALVMGATHMAAAAINVSDDELCWIENDLIQALTPPLNQIAPPGFGMQGYK